MIVRVILRYNGVSEKKLKRVMEELTNIKIRNNRFPYNHREKIINIIKEFEGSEILNVERLF